MKTLITFLGWVPVLGNILKVSYIASCAKEALSKVKVDDPGKIKSIEWVTRKAKLYNMA